VGEERELCRFRIITLQRNVQPRRRSRQEKQPIYKTADEGYCAHGNKIFLTPFLFKKYCREIEPPE